MKRIYQAGNLQDAYILSNLLSAARIDHHILNSYQHGGVGELPFTHTYPEIWLVNENDESKARALIAEFEQPLANETPERACSRCGELNPATFQICWHCGEEI